MAYRLAKISSKRFFKNLKKGHKIRPIYEGKDNDSSGSFVDENGEYTEAYWDMVRETDYQIEHNIGLIRITTDEELHRYIYGV